MGSLGVSYRDDNGTELWGEVLGTLFDSLLSLFQAIIHKQITLLPETTFSPTEFFGVTVQVIHSKF